MNLFEWDEAKNKQNIIKHNVSFKMAEKAFDDPDRIIFIDINHSSKKEIRFFCLGLVNGLVCTVRFILRDNKIRIFGAGFWRKGRKQYEKEKK